MGELHSFTHKETVVQNVPVRESRPLREARRAAGELNIDRVGGLERLADRRKTLVLQMTAGKQSGKSAHTRHLGRACSDIDVGASIVDPNYMSEIRHAGSPQFSLSCLDRK